MPPSRPAARTILLTLIAFAVTLGACTARHPAPSAGPTNRPSPITSYGQITYDVTYTFTGASAVSGTFQRPVISHLAPTCAQSASLGNQFSQPGTFDVPTPPNDAYPLIEITLSTYKGPATYTADHDVPLAGFLMLSAAAPQYNVAAHGTNGTLTVRSDGSGSYSFSDAHPEGPTATVVPSPGPSPTTPPASPSPIGPGLNGSITWTCSS
jgi:hypothetical protein